MKLSDAIVPIKVAMMDAAQKASIRRLNVLGNDCPCKPGCSSCCSRLVQLSVAEALVIYDYLKTKNLWSKVRENATSHYKLALSLDETSWFKMNIPCSVLDPKTKTCMAYLVRPTSCSVHFVVSDPSVCDPWSTSEKAFEKIDFPDIHKEFMDVVHKELSERSVLELRLPIPSALLFAEKIQMQKGLTADQIISILAQETR